MNLRKIFFLIALGSSISPGLWAAPNGAELFSEHCSACHGPNGAGGVGVPLSLPSFLDSVSDECLAKSIRYGRPGRVMPAFTQFSNAQIGALVSHIRSWSSQPAPRYSDTPIPGNATNGAKLYQTHCASCHGIDGKGGTGTGVTFSRPRELPIIAPALSNPGYLIATSDQMIKTTLMNGRKGTPMSSFLEAGLSEQDIDDLVAYVRSFEATQGTAEQHKDPGEPATLEYPSSYSMEETINNVKEAAIGKNYRVVRIQNLDNGFVPEARESDKTVIIYFCNFRQLNDALAIDPRVGLFLPCRVTVTERDHKVQVSAVNPLTLSKLFNNDELERICSKMADIYHEILEEATL